jgi:hypothetical protein
MAGRWLGAAVSVAAIAAVASPVLRDPARGDSDGFPLSTYPMFARSRPTVLELDYALGIPAAGAPHFLAPRLIGSREVLQARAIVARAMRGGPQAQAELCADIAARVAADEALADVVHVALVRGRHDAVELLVRGVRGTETERLRCAVERRGPAER